MEVPSSSALGLLGFISTHFASTAHATEGTAHPGEAKATCPLAASATRPRPHKPHTHSRLGSVVAARMGHGLVALRPNKPSMAQGCYGW